MSAEYLLEVRCQEMAPEQLLRLLKRLGTRLFEDLMSRGLPPEEMITAATLRRLAICFRGLPERDRDRHEEELGPPAAEAWDAHGAATEALQGFAERLGVEVGDLVRHKTERGDYAAYLRDVEGRPVRELLADIVPRVLRELVRPADGAFGSAQWVRPVIGALSVLDGEILPLRLDDIDAGAETVPHAVLHTEAVEVDGWSAYEESLAACGVVVRWGARRTRIDELVDAAAEAASGPSGRRTESTRLLDRLTGKVEIPAVVVGRFDPEYLGLPSELVVATLEDELDAFGVVEGEAGKDELLPVFVTAFDAAGPGEAGEDPRRLETVRAGLERACAGHLEDLRFHVDNDRRVPLAERAQRLEHLTLHERLGSWADKGRRVQKLVELAIKELAVKADDATVWMDHQATAREAAILLKADLTTAVVRQHPSLRGTVGGLYARDEGYAPTVWQAIYDQYRPASKDGPIPRHPVGQVLALCDRLGSLVGFLGIGGAPTGSRDPFALRRLAIGLLRIVLDAELEIDLELLAARAVLLFDDALDRGAEDIVRDLRTLLDDRLDFLLGRRGFTYDEIEAAKAVGTSNLVDLVARLEALHAVRGEDGFADLVRAARRISNIVQDQAEQTVDPELLEAEAEVELHRRRESVAQVVQEAAEERRYEDCLRAALGLAPDLDRFFAEVLVMDEDERLRANRLGLLQACRRLYWRVGRLKALVVDSEPGADSAAGPVAVDELAPSADD